MADLASILEDLRQNRSTGCAIVESPTMGTWRLYFLFGKAFNATGPSSDGDMAVAQALACGDATTTFDSTARLPAEQNLTKVPGTDEPLEPDASPQEIPHPHQTLIVRSCLVTSVLLFVVGPAAGIAFAVWLGLTPTASEAEAAKAYTNAPGCPATSTAKDCVRSERAELISIERLPGRFGSHTDRLTLKLADGVHQTEIYANSTGPFQVAPYAYYAPVGGPVLVREFRGHVTTVYGADGKGYETADSPTGGANWRAGIAAAMIAVLAPILLVAAILLIWGLGLRDFWRMLRRPTRPLPTYPAA